MRTSSAAAASSARAAEKRSGPPAIFSRYLAAPDVALVGAGHADLADDAFDTVFVDRRLQDIADYRAAIQGWFRAVRQGGHLLLTVPHAFLHDRRLALPASWSRTQRRLYTPASLAAEVEEALAPNSYRVRLLCDLDAGYDYGADPDARPEGEADVAIAIEKIATPYWDLMRPRAPEHIVAARPDFAFEPERTRIERAMLPPRQRILILKLDHIGDFINAIPALERARALFADVHVTLVVGPWNVGAAQALGIADEVVGFDAFPVNSTEEEPNVHYNIGRFRALGLGEYDLAIDLRADTDTRQLLNEVRATRRAGFGTRAMFRFLDIFLPLEFNRNKPETAKEEHFSHRHFPSQGPVKRNDYRLFSDKDRVERHCAIVWGPYRRLRAGRYIFEPHLELGPNDHGGLLKLDIGLDHRGTAEMVVAANGRHRLEFDVARPDTQFEFRIWTVEGLPSIDFSFYGGRLMREGAASVLHQSEYAMLLIDLVAMKTDRFGMLAEAST